MVKAVTATAGVAMAAAARARAAVATVKAAAWARPAAAPCWAAWGGQLGRRGRPRPAGSHHAGRSQQQARGPRGHPHACRLVRRPNTGHPQPQVDAEADRLNHG